MAMTMLQRKSNAKANLTTLYKFKKLLTTQTKRWITLASDDVVTVKKRGLIGMIGINRPDKKNAFNYDIALGIDKALTAIENDDSLRAAILYGERGNLCVGYDLEDLETDSEMIDKITELGLTNRFSKIPLVAAVSGFTQGPGFELALWCDFRIVEESAVLGGFAKQLGMPMSEELANKFVSILGFNKAMDWILTGRTVKGKEALECGVANRLVAVGTSLGQAFSFASGLANMPEACLRADRASLYLASQKYNETKKEIIMKERASMAQQAILEKRVSWSRAGIITPNVMYLNVNLCVNPLCHNVEKDFKEKKYRSFENGDVRKRKS